MMFEGQKWLTHLGDEGQPETPKATCWSADHHQWRRLSRRSLALGIPAGYLEDLR